MNQRTWRIAGGLAIGLSALLALFGDDTFRGERHLGFLIVYWGLFLLCLLVALFAVVLDLRYIRAQYAVEQRDAFRDTLGNKEFRETLLKAQREYEREQNAERE